MVMVAELLISLLKFMIVLSIHGILALFLVLQCSASDAKNLTVIPPHDTIIARSSPDNVTYNCTDDSSNDVVLWVVNGYQILLEADIQKFAHLGVFVEGPYEGSESKLVMTAEARTYLGPNVTICWYSHNPKLGIGIIADSALYWIVEFGAPSAPTDLQLSSNFSRISWRGPPGTYAEVVVKYTVSVTNRNTGALVQHIETSQESVAILVPDCGYYSFTVEARNEAGPSEVVVMNASFPLCTASVTYTDSAALLRCELMNGSSASGCRFVFTDGANYLTSYNVTIEQSSGHCIDFEPPDTGNEELDVLVCALDSDGKIVGKTVRLHLRKENGPSQCLTSSPTTELNPTSSAQQNRASVLQVVVVTAVCTVILSLDVI